MEDISDTLLKQRLRNRLIASLHNFFAEEAVGELGTDEIINTWYDYMSEDKVEFYDRPVFNEDELKVLRNFHNLVEYSNEKVPGTWKLSDLDECVEWAALVAAAMGGHSTFMKRGQFDENREVL